MRPRNPVPSPSELLKDFAFVGEFDTECIRSSTMPIMQNDIGFYWPMIDIIDDDLYYAFVFSFNDDGKCDMCRFGTIGCGEHYSTENVQFFVCREIELRL